MTGKPTVTGPILITTFNTVIYVADGEVQHSGISLASRQPAEVDAH
jgi:hypothetical protein